MDIYYRLNGKLRYTGDSGYWPDIVANPHLYSKNEPIMANNERAIALVEQLIPNLDPDLVELHNLRKLLKQLKPETIQIRDGFVTKGTNQRVWHRARTGPESYSADSIWDLMSIGPDNYSLNKPVVQSVTYQD